MIKLKNFFKKNNKNSFENYIKSLIKRKVDLDINKIQLLEARKTKINIKNEFNYFLFRYNNKIYELLDDKLTIKN